eukprot:s1352_g7.t2
MAWKAVTHAVPEAVKYVSVGITVGRRFELVPLVTARLQKLVPDRQPYIISMTAGEAQSRNKRPSYLIFLPCQLYIISMTAGEAQSRNKRPSYLIFLPCQLAEKDGVPTSVACNAHETCVQLCRSASELPAFRFAFARHVLTSIWLLEKVYGTAALAAISPLLGPKEDLATRKQACDVALHFLTSSTLAHVGDDIRVPPVCPLGHVEVPTAFAFEECMDILHHLVELCDSAPDSAKVCLKALASRELPKSELSKLLRCGLIVPSSTHREFVESLVAQA